MRHNILMAGAVIGALLLTGCTVSVNADPTVTSDPTPTVTAVQPRTVRGAPSWEPAANDKTVYLTFDDGPWRDTNEILDILKANDVKATFFQIGKMIRTREATNERIWAEGHVIANHTWDHVDLATLGAGAITEQLQMTQDHIGPRAATCMRPPYGSLNAKARGIAQSFGLTPILWTRDTNDWARSATSGSIYSTLMRTVPGDVVLMHDGGGDRQATVDALREALPKLKAKGYHFGIVPACRIPEQAK